MIIAGPRITRLRESAWWARGAKTGGYVATIVVVVAVWTLVTFAGWVSAQTLPGPLEVADAMQTLASAGELWSNLASTLFRILLSFAIGLILGIPLGAALWRFPRAGGALRPYLAASYSVPLVVFYPFFLVVLGLNDWPVVLLTAVMTTIPIALNTSLGLQSAPKVLVNVGKSMERTPAQIFRQILLPAAWPYMLAGIKLSIVYGVVGVVSLEFVAAQAGLGNRIQYYYEIFDPPSMYAFIILTLLLSGVGVGLVLLAEALTMRGRENYSLTDHVGATGNAPFGVHASNARARQTHLAKIIQMLIAPLAAVALWYVLSWTVFVVPAPHEAVRTLVSDLGNEQYRRDLLATTAKIAAAFGAASALGVVMGAALGLIKPLREALEPFVLILNGIPKIVLYPILLIVFGLGSASQITMGVIFGTLPVLVNLMSALASMRPVYRKVARMVEAGPLRAMFSVYAPAVMPMLIVSLQLGFSLSVLGVIYSELIASRNGLGQSLIETYSVGNYDKLSADVLAILFIALAGAGVLHLVEWAIVRRR